MTRRPFHFTFFWLCAGLCLMPTQIRAVQPEQPSRQPRAALAPAAPSPQAQHPVLTAQLGHANAVVSVVFSRDGRYVLSGSEDKTARLWETATGKEIRSFGGHAGAVMSDAFSPDGRYVLTGSDDKTARLWETATGQPIRSFQGHTEAVSSVAFSPGGRYVLTGGEDKTARLWEAATGKPIRSLRGHTAGVFAVAFSPDGRYVLTGSDDKTVRLWETATGKEIRRFQGHTGWLTSVAFSAEGRYVLTGSADKTARLWETATGKQIRIFQGHTDGVTSVAISPNGRYVLTGSFDKSARVWETATGQEIRRFPGHSFAVYSVAFSPDGRYLLTGSFDRHGIARLWEIATGKEIRSFEGRAVLIASVTVSSDGRYLLTSSADGTARLWETATGQQIRNLQGHVASVDSVAFSPDGRYVLAGGIDHAARLWETATGQEIRSFPGHTGSVEAVAFSADGRYVLTGSRDLTGKDNTARLWETETGKEIRRFEGHTAELSAVAVSRDGRYVLTGADVTARLWETATGKEIRSFQGHRDAVIAVAFSPDGRYVLTGSLDGTARLWETATGQEIRRYQGRGDWLTSAAFSPDGRVVLTTGRETLNRDISTASVWDTATGQEIRTFGGHGAEVTSAAFSAEGRYVLTGSADHTVRLWEIATGRQLCSLISFENGTWAVTDAQGRYDASNAGEVEGLHWVVGNEPIALNQLKARYYDPGLLSKYLGVNKEPLRNVAAFDKVALYPEVQVMSVAAGQEKLALTLTNRGGGIGQVQVFVNGKEFTADARGPHPDPQAKQATLTVDLSQSPALIPGQPNMIRIVAYNAEGYLASRGTELVFAPPGKAATAPIELYAIIGGIDDYSSNNLHLNLPSHDAANIANAITLGAKRLFGVDKVHLLLLSSDSTDKRTALPIKPNFAKAFEQARKARPGDILVVYLAGHGVAIQDTYCYLTQEARSFDLSDPAVRKQCSLTSEELAEWTKKIPALKQVLILDTCAAGAAAQKLVERRDIPGDQVRAIDRLKDRTGFYVLMGCASDAVSYEASQYGQGLLTYALLQGMQGARLRDGEFVDVSPLFEYAADTVPQLAQGIGGIQRPQIIAPIFNQTSVGRQQASFDIGQLKPEDKQQIQLPQPRPLLLRPLLLNVDEGTDNLKLNLLLGRRLQEASYAAARGPGVVFVDAEEMPGALRPSGTYTVMAGKVVVRLVLSRDEVKVASVQVVGSQDDLAGLVAKLVSEIVVVASKR